MGKPVVFSTHFSEGVGEGGFSFFYPFFRMSHLLYSSRYKTDGVGGDVVLEYILSSILHLHPCSCFRPFCLLSCFQLCSKAVYSMSWRYYLPLSFVAAPLTCFLFFNVSRPA